MESPEIEILKKTVEAEFFYLNRQIHEMHDHYIDNPIEETTKSISGMLAYEIDAFLITVENIQKIPSKYYLAQQYYIKIALICAAKIEYHRHIKGGLANCFRYLNLGFRCITAVQQILFFRNEEAYIALDLRKKAEESLKIIKSKDLFIHEVLTTLENTRPSDGWSSIVVAINKNKGAIEKLIAHHGATQRIEGKTTTLTLKSLAERFHKRKLTGDIENVIASLLMVQRPRKEAKINEEPNPIANIWNDSLLRNKIDETDSSTNESPNDN